MKLHIDDTEEANNLADFLIDDSSRFSFERNSSTCTFTLPDHTTEDLDTLQQETADWMGINLDELSTWAI